MGSPCHGVRVENKGILRGKELVDYRLKNMDLTNNKVTFNDDASQPRAIPGASDLVTEARCAPQSGMEAAPGEAPPRRTFGEDRSGPSSDVYSDALSAFVPPPRYDANGALIKQG